MMKSNNGLSKDLSGWPTVAIIMFLLLVISANLLYTGPEAILSIRLLNLAGILILSLAAINASVQYMFNSAR